MSICWGKQLSQLNILHLSNSMVIKSKYYSNFSTFFKVINFIKFLFALPIIILVILINPILKIKFGKIKTKTIGDCALPIEVFYNEIKRKKIKQFELHIWCHDSVVANKFWLNKIKSKILILPGIIIDPIFNFFFKSTIGQNFLIPIRNTDTGNNPHKVKRIEDLSPHSDIYGVLKNNPLLINFNAEEVVNGNNFLQKNGIGPKDKFICIHSRSSSYRNESFTSVRNSSINNFELSCDFLINKGFKIIRVGRDEKLPFIVKSKSVFDYAINENQNDFLDFFIISKCAFFLGGDSGLVNIAKVFRKPVMIHNILNLRDIIHYVGDSEKIILPKKIWSLKKKKFLHFNETLKNNYNKIRDIDIKNKDLELVENTNQEILGAVKEMFEIVVNNKRINQDQSDFFNYYEKMYPNPLVKKVKISPEFYKNNIDLFENDVQKL